MKTVTIAIIFNRTEAARALIKAGADMEINDDTGSTPLYIAALFCRVEIIKALLNQGANKYARNNSGSPAFARK